MRSIGWKGLTAVVAVLLAVLFTASQLLLPAIAARNLEGSLALNGTDVHVSISAFPAVELLLGEADSVNVTVGRLTSSKHHVGSLLARAANVGDLSARVGVLDTHGLILTDVVLEKRGGLITASATVTRAAIAAVLPLSLSIADPQNGSAGLVVHGNVRLLGQEVSATAAVGAEHGNIVLHPVESGIAGLLNAIDITLFHSPLVWVDSVKVAIREGGVSLVL